MIEDEKPQGLGLKRRLIFATIITVLCSAISGLLTLVWAQLPIGGYTGLAIILLIGIIISVFLVWKNYRGGERRLAVKLSIATVVVSMIQVLAMLYLTAVILSTF